jgi:hypothetical protein
MIIGGVAGFLIESYRTQGGDSHFGKTRFVKYMTEELNLTQMQQKQLDSIITYVHPKFRAIREKFNADMQSETDSTRKMITSILSDQQKQKLQVVLSPARNASAHR